MLMGMCACSGGIPYNMMYYIIISALTRLEKLIIISRLSKSKRFSPKIYSVVVKLVLFQLKYTGYSPERNRAMSLHSMYL